jgi:ankyrin repeat protein
MLAASAGNLECLEALLDLGADSTILSAVDSKTALEISEGKGHKGVIARLKQAGGKGGEL